MLQCIGRVQKYLIGENIPADDLTSRSVISTSDNVHKLTNETTEESKTDGKTLSSTESLVCAEDFRRLLKIHNKIQAVQCFQYPPNALCCDSKELVREVGMSTIGFFNFVRYSNLPIVSSYCPATNPCLRYLSDF